MAKKLKFALLIIFIFLAGTISGFIITAQLKLSNLEGKDTKPYFVEGDSGTLESPFVRVAEIATPAVVNISTERVVKFRTSPFFDENDPFEQFFRKFFEMPIPSIPREYKSTSLGSGFIFRRDGDKYYILTNNHVIKDASKIIVKLNDGTTITGDNVKVLGTDKSTDLAVLQIKTKKEIPVLKLGDSDKIRVGDWAIAVGNPFGLEGTLTVGVISAKGRSGIPLPEGPIYENFIQTDAAINPGNSGGPLLNIRGEVIGINTAITSPSGAYAGVGFAIPINTAKFVVEQILKKGKVIRGYLGVYPQAMTPDLAKTYNLDRVYGVLVAKVLKDSPADKAGLQEGDVILKFNGKEVSDVENFRLMVAHTQPGEVVTLEVVKENGVRKTLKVKIGEYPNESPKQEEQEDISESEEAKNPEASWLGMTVISTELARQYNLYSGNEAGVVVKSVEPGSVADFAGIVRGDLIQKIGEYQIKDISDFVKASKAYKNAQGPLRFKILRNGMPIFIAVTVR